MDAGAQGAVPPLQDTMKRVLLVVPGLGVGGVERSLLALLKLAPLTRLDCQARCRPASAWRATGGRDGWNVSGARFPGH